MIAFESDHAALTVGFDSQGRVSSAVLVVRVALYLLFRAGEDDQFDGVVEPGEYERNIPTPQRIHPDDGWEIMARPVR